MKRLARNFFIPILLACALAQNSAAQDTRGEPARSVGAKGLHDDQPHADASTDGATTRASDAIEKGFQSGTTRSDAGALTPKASSSGAALYQAEAADRGGDAERSLEEYRFAYDRAKEALEKSEPASPQAVEYLRQMGSAGYNLAWDEFERGDQAEGKKILAALEARLGAYETKPAPPALLLPAANFLWLKYSKTNLGDAEDARLKKRVLELSSKRDSFLWDYGPLSKQYFTALWWFGATDSERRLNREKACHVAGEMDHLMSDQWTHQVVRCDLETALNLEKIKHYGAALGELKRAEARLAAAEQRQKASKELKLDIVEALNMEAKIGELDPTLGLDPQKTEEKAGRLFTSALGDGSAYRASDEVSRLFVPIIGALARPRIAGPEDPATLRFRAAYFGDMAKAVAPTRRYYPSVMSVASVEAGAALQASLADLDLDQPSSALPSAKEAIAAFEAAKILPSFDKYSGFSERVFEAYAAEVDAYVRLKEPQAALNALHRWQGFCLDWLQRYPWDLRARKLLVDSTQEVGVLLSTSGKAAEARPLLEYASNWGDRAATRYLAESFKSGEGGDKDLKRSEALFALAKKQTEPEISLIAQKGEDGFMFNVVLHQYAPGRRCPVEGPLKPEDKDCVGFIGIDDYAKFLTVDNPGYALDAGVVKAFQSIEEPAGKTELGYPEYSYALLRKALEPDVAATPEAAAAIYAEMQRLAFHRSPRRLIDNAGVAIKGYDPVAYFTQDRAVAGKAENFVLWDGAVWLFSTPANRAAFLKDPVRYTPQYGGYSASEIAENALEWPGGALYLVTDGKLYLFSTALRRSLWKTNASYVTPLADQNWPLLKPTNADISTKLADLIVARGTVPGPTDDEVSRSELPTRDKDVQDAERSGKKSDLVEALGNRSWSLILLDRADDALADIDRALALDPTIPWITANRADALLMKGRYDEALSIYKIVADKPGPNGGKKTMCYFIIGDLASLRTSKLADATLLQRMGRDIQCRSEPAPPSAPQPH